MKFMKFYFEEKKSSLEKKWKLLQFLDEGGLFDENISSDEVKEDKKIIYTGYKISRLKELFK